jgi:hypothetical protein
LSPLAAYLGAAKKDFLRGAELRGAFKRQVEDLPHCGAVMGRYFTFLSTRSGKKNEREAPAVPGVVDFARGTLGFEPDLRQAEVLESTAKRGILNCTRQWGKSTVAGIMALHRAHTKPGVLVVVASPTERQSGEFF